MNIVPGAAGDNLVGLVNIGVIGRVGEYLGLIQYVVVLHLTCPLYDVAFGFVVGGYLAQGEIGKEFRSVLANSLVVDVD